MGLLQHAARTFAHLQCFSEAQEMQKNRCPCQIFGTFFGRRQPGKLSLGIAGGRDHKVQQMEHMLFVNKVVVQEIGRIFKKYTNAHIKDQEKKKK